ncbi:MAG: GNAT family N-acetyltransferase [Clostridia bacterium]|nr:GNAT family N-acetyltransferase [Clostridia bacterium]
MNPIRTAEERDVSRIAEILVFNNRLNFYPIFQNDDYSFGELQVVPMAEEFRSDPALLARTFVYDDDVVRGLIVLDGTEISKLFVDPCFQNRGIGAALLKFAVEVHHADVLWALEKNVRGIRFYERHGFRATGEKIFEDDTTEYLIRMKRRNDSGDHP